MTKIVAMYFLQLRIIFNYKPKKLTSTSWQWHFSWKRLQHVNATSIAITKCSSCKLSYQLSFEMSSTSLDQWMNFIHWPHMISTKYLVVISTTFQLCQVNQWCGDTWHIKTFHHCLVIIVSWEVNYVATTMINAFSQWQDDMCCILIGFGVDQ